jgi:Na+-transporting methylmalonyl-CoA/oxaloacetate decarboxylase gamma subunit
MESELINGIVIGIGGLLVVFLGLILIEIVIHFFSRYFEKKELRKSAPALPEKETVTTEGSTTPVPEDDLVAIATAIEFYRKVHFDQLQSQITFVRGNQQNNWKIGAIANSVIRN